LIGARWLVEPGEKFELAKIDPGSTEGAPGRKSVTEAAIVPLREELSRLQERLWAEHRRSLLVVLQAMDTGGKDGTIRNVFSGVNPQGMRVVSFKAPSQDELDHDFLWRIHRAAPAAGEMGVFNRSHYEDVAIVRVHNLVPKRVWRERFGLITDFEKQLAHGGTTVVKFFLHISKDEQLSRLKARLEDPEKRWKFNTADLIERALWDDYQVAYQDAIRKTSSESAPWYVLPANHKWYRNWAVATVLVDTLKQMDPRVPEPQDLEGVEIV
jgi:PPK2 family polyphosphate:nucleotide phosphotransferase